MSENDGEAKSAEESQSLDKDDNLPSRQKAILERLTSIRSNKQRILLTLRGLKENLKEDEEPDKELMGKMIGSYDALSAQEEEYMKLMQHIVSIRENAAEDVQQELTELQQSAPAPPVDGNEEIVEGVSVGGLPADTEPPPESNADWKEVEAELANLGAFTNEAIAASTVNEKLVETLQLHREKRATLQRIREKESETQRGVANEALEQVEMARNQVAAEQEQIERKRRTLERLRREALRRGIKVGPGSASEPDILIEPPPEPKSATEAKLRAKLNAKKKQTEDEEKDDGPPVPENLAPAERIPPIAIGEQGLEAGAGAEAPVAEGGGMAVAAGKRKKKGKKARELARQKRDAISSSIREKLAVIQARRQRISEIRAQLMRPTVSADDMDETFHRAQEQLKSLTAMREQLEEMRDNGDELPEEAAELLEKHLAEADASQPTFVPVTDSELLADADQAEAAVREEFERVMGVNASEMAAGFDPEATASLLQSGHDRLGSIERLLIAQQGMLRYIAGRVPSTPAQLQDVRDEEAPNDEKPSLLTVASLRKCFLSANSSLLLSLGQLLLDLGSGHQRPDLDATLAALLKCANEEKQKFEECENVKVNQNESCKPEDLQQSSPAVVTKESSEAVTTASSEVPLESKERTPDALKAELAKRRLSSGRAKLQKQRTLEKVRCLAGEETTDDRKVHEENLQGLERDICLIAEGILPWLKENAEKTVSEALMHDLRDEIVRRSTSVCFPGLTPSDLFESQLSTIIDDTLSQYYGEVLGAEREQLLFDISEILYNELAFFQLMHNMDNMAISEGTVANSEDNMATTEEQPIAASDSTEQADATAHVDGAIEDPSVS